MKILHSWLFYLFIVSIVLITPVCAQTSATISVSGIVPTFHKPISSFIASPTSGSEPLNVQFTDQSTYSPTSWKWEYRGQNGGWKQFSTSQNPTISFSKGKYDIRLTVTNSLGSSSLIKQNYIDAKEKLKPKKPVAIFSMSTDYGTQPLKVIFTDRSLNNPTSWRWNFGDGSTSTLQNPTHSYAKAGFYRARLTVTNNIGIDSMERLVVVIPRWSWWSNWWR